MVYLLSSKIDCLTILIQYKRIGFSKMDHLRDRAFHTFSIHVCP